MDMKSGKRAIGAVLLAAVMLCAGIYGPAGQGFAADAPKGKTIVFYRNGEECPEAEAYTFGINDEVYVSIKGGFFIPAEDRYGAKCRVIISAGSSEILKEEAPLTSSKDENGEEKHNIKYPLPHDLTPETQYTLKIEAAHQNKNLVGVQPAVFAYERPAEFKLEPVDYCTLQTDAPEAAADEKAEPQQALPETEDTAPEAKPDQPVENKEPPEQAKDSKYYYIRSEENADAPVTLRIQYYAGKTEMKFQYCVNDTDIWQDVPWNGEAEEVEGKKGWMQFTFQPELVYIQAGDPAASEDQYTVKVKAVLPDERELDAQTVDFTVLHALELRVDREEICTDQTQPLTVHVNRKGGEARLALEGKEPEAVKIENGEAKLPLPSDLTAGTVLTVEYVNPLLPQDTKQATVRVIPREITAVLVSGEQAYRGENSKITLKADYEAGQTAEGKNLRTEEVFTLDENGEVSLPLSGLQDGDRLAFYYRDRPESSVDFTVRLNPGEEEDALKEPALVIRTLEGIRFETEAPDEDIKRIEGKNAWPNEKVSLRIIRPDQDAPTELDVIADENGGFSWDLPLDDYLPAGTTILASAWDPYGNESKTDDLTIVPAELASISAGLVPGTGVEDQGEGRYRVRTNGLQHLSLAGKAHPNRTLRLRYALNGSEQEFTVRCKPDGEWTYDMPVPELRDSLQAEFVLQVEYEPGEGENAQENAVSLQIAVDNNPGNIVVTLPIIENDRQIAVSGKPGATFTLRVNGEETDNQTSDENGAVILDAGRPLRKGDKVAVHSKDLLGNIQDSGEYQAADAPLILTAGEGKLLLSTAENHSAVALALSGTRGGNVVLFRNGEKFADVTLDEAEGKAEYALTFGDAYQWYGDGEETISLNAAYQDGEGNTAPVTVAYDAVCVLTLDQAEPLKSDIKALSGTADGNAEVTLYVNGEEKSTVRADGGNGRFVFDGLKFSGGEQLRIAEKDASGNTREWSPAPVVRSTLLSWQQYLFMMVAGLTVFAFSLLGFLSSRKKLKEIDQLTTHYRERGTVQVKK